MHDRYTCIKCIRCIVFVCPSELINIQAGVFCELRNPKIHYGLFFDAFMSTSICNNCMVFQVIQVLHKYKLKSCKYMHMQVMKHFFLVSLKWPWVATS